MADSIEEFQRKFKESLTRPSSARIYDYHLGGENNYAIDREFAKMQCTKMPNIAEAMRSNRAFQGRAVRYAVKEGIRQFVDIGSGLPSAGQANQVADEEAPGESSVVFVDNEPIAKAHAEALIGRDSDPERNHAIDEDFFNYVDCWQGVLNSGIIDPEKPICLLLLGMLHFMQPEEHPEKPLAFYREQLPPGSLLVMSHACDELNDEGIQNVVQDYDKTTNRAYLRSREEFTTFFGDFDLVEPGIVWAPEWGPADDLDEWEKPALSRYLVGIGRKA